MDKWTHPNLEVFGGNIKWRHLTVEDVVQLYMEHFGKNKEYGVDHGWSSLIHDVMLRSCATQDFPFMNPCCTENTRHLLSRWLQVASVMMVSKVLQMTDVKATGWLFKASDWSPDLQVSISLGVFLVEEMTGRCTVNWAYRAGCLFQKGRWKFVWSWWFLLFKSVRNR